MDLVIDANVLFSMLIKRGKTEELFFEEDLHLFAPEFLFEEFDKYSGLVLAKTERSKEEFDELMIVLKKRIRTLPNKETERFIPEEMKICPDEGDVDYFAIALMFRCPIWSNDKALKAQDAVIVYSTEDLVRMFSR